MRDKTKNKIKNKYSLNKKIKKSQIRNCCSSDLDKISNFSHLEITYFIQITRAGPKFVADINPI